MKKTGPKSPRVHEHVGIALHLKEEALAAGAAHASLALEEIAELDGWVLLLTVMSEREFEGLGQ